MIGRFNKPASYYLVYGKDYENKPNYDLAHFTDEIPDSLISLNLGEEQKIEQKEPTTKEPLFKNKNLLWGLILLIIVSLSWFSLQMIKKN